MGRRTIAGLRFSSQIETDMYSGVKIHVIKFAKGIDYVSYVCFPQEEVVMALTSKGDVKSDCLTCYSCMFKYYIVNVFLDDLSYKLFVSDHVYSKDK